RAHRLLVGADPPRAGRRAPLHLGYGRRARHRQCRSAVVGKRRPVDAADGGAVGVHRIRARMGAGMAMITPLKRVRGLGSAHEGPDPFVKQRVTAAANAILLAFAVGLIARLAGADLATVKATLGHPVVAIALVALIVSVTVHMRIG